MKSARLLALLAAALVAAVAVYAFSRPAKGPATPRQGTAAAEPSFEAEPVGKGAPGDPPKPPGETGKTVPQAPKMPDALPEVGTAVAPGAQVSVVIPWGKGAKSKFRYEIEDVVATTDRKTDRVEPARTVYWVTLAILEGDGSGAARLRMTIDANRMQFLGPTGLPIDVDSRVPRDSQLDDPGVQRRVLPTWALLGRPIEFRIDAVGEVLDVDGIEDWRDRYVEEVRRIEKNATAEVEDEPSRDWVTDRWREFLFPKIGGGTIAGGASRPWQVIQRAGGGWSVVWDGKARATRDDPDAFRVEITAKPHQERTGGVPVNANQANIAAIQAHGRDDSLRAAYRFSRTEGTLLEAQLDFDWFFNGSRLISAATPGRPAQYDPRFMKIQRRIVVKRIPE